MALHSVLWIMKEGTIWFVQNLGRGQVQFASKKNKYIVALRQVKALITSSSLYAEKEAEFTTKVFD
jgi:hypothetical protein